MNTEFEKQLSTNLNMTFGKLTECVKHVRVCSNIDFNKGGQKKIFLNVKIVFKKDGPKTENETDILNTKQKEIMEFVQEWYKKTWAQMQYNFEKEIIENMNKSFSLSVSSDSIFYSDRKYLYERDTDAIAKKFKSKWVSCPDSHKHDYKKNSDGTISCEIKNSAEFVSELMVKDIYFCEHEKLSSQKKILMTVILWVFSPFWAFIRALNKTFWYLKESKSSSKKYILSPVKFFKSYFLAFRAFKNLTKATFSNRPNMFIYSNSKTKDKFKLKKPEPKYGYGISNANNNLSIAEYYKVVSGLKSVRPLQELDADFANNKLEF